MILISYKLMFMLGKLYGNYHLSRFCGKISKGWKLFHAHEQVIHNEYCKRSFESLEKNLRSISVSDSAVFCFLFTFSCYSKQLFNSLQLLFFLMNLFITNFLLHFLSYVLFFFIITCFISCKNVFTAGNKLF